MEEAPRCPVCRAGLRGATQCSRCGADLRPLMALMVQAHALRRAARQSVRTGELAKAHSLAQSAQARCPTQPGRQLLLLTRWLEEWKTGRME